MSDRSETWPDRVALVVASPDIVGGHSVQARELVGGLSSEGCRVQVVPIDPRFPHGLRWVRRLPYARTVLNECLYLPSLSALASADLVHVFAASYTGFLLASVPAVVAARLLRKPVVLHYHSGEAEDHLTHWGVAVHPWLRLANVIAVPSQYLAAVFARHGYRATVAPNVVDLSRFSYRERALLCPRLVSNRNLEAHYGLDDILAAFTRVRAAAPDATLTIAGSGSDERRLRRLAGSGVRFVGSVSPDAMPALLDAADIFLNASLIDNQPVSILEAFAAGIPVVSTPTGDIAAMAAHGHAARLVPARRPDALARAVLQLLRSPREAVAVARRARRLLETYTWRSVRERWSSIYRTAADMTTGVQAGSSLPHAL